MSDNNYISVLLEEIREQNKALLEGQERLLGLPGKVSELEENMSEIKADVKIVKAAITDLSHQVNRHERTFPRLKQQPEV